MPSGLFYPRMRIIEIGGVLYQEIDPKAASKQAKKSKKKIKPKPTFETYIIKLKAFFFAFGLFLILWAALIISDQWNKPDKQDKGTKQGNNTTRITSR